MSSSLSLSIHHTRMAPHQTSTGLQDQRDTTPNPPLFSVPKIADGDAQSTNQLATEETSPSNAQHIPLPNDHSELLSEIEEAHPHDPNRLCFFYGSLMDSGNITSVLDLAAEPDLTPACIEGYRTLINGPFPALVRANNSIVAGMVYRMNGSDTDVRDQITELENYEGEDYERFWVVVRFEKSLEWGWTFLWVGDAKELQEGVWDFEAWRQQWGRAKKCVSESPPMDRYGIEDAQASVATERLSMTEREGGRAE